ncbi:MAG: hypothetical protein ABIB97_03505 [Patescibacteria group bacterium]
MKWLNLALISICLLMMAAEPVLGLIDLEARWGNDRKCIVLDGNVLLTLEEEYGQDAKVVFDSYWYSMDMCFRGYVRVVSDYLEWRDSHGDPTGEGAITSQAEMIDVMDSVSGSYCKRQGSVSGLRVSGSDQYKQQLAAECKKYCNTGIYDAFDIYCYYSAGSILEEKKLFDWPDTADTEYHLGIYSEVTAYYQNGGDRELLVKDVLFLLMMETEGQPKSLINGFLERMKADSIGWGRGWLGFTGPPEP